MRFRDSGCRVITRMCLLVGLAAIGGCRQDTGRWDQAQSNSDGRTAQESSADRGVANDQTTNDGDTATANSEPPPFTPGAPSKPSEAVTWTPKGDRPPASGAPQIDIAKLATGDPLPGGEFNKFFPKQSGNYDMVAKQEKEGFAEYSLRRDGQEIGQLSVTDLRSNPEVAEKFREPDLTIENLPAKKDGSKGTTVLVAQRFQLKVRSPGGELNEADRVNWLKQFDLSGIAALAD